MLVATFRSNPSLAESVRITNLNWHGARRIGEKTPEHDSGISNTKSNEILSLLPNIESLSVSTESDCWPFTPDFLTHNPVPNLREIRLPGFGTSFDDVLPLLAIPSIDELVVNHPDTDRPPEAPPVDNVQRRSLTKLYLGSDSMHLSSLGKYLEHLDGLKGLQIGSPYLDADVNEDDTSENPTLMEQADEARKMHSPSGVGLLLEPFKTTLNELCLTNSSYGRRPGKHDGTRLDLSEFVNLKRMIVSSDVFFTSPMPLPSEERRGVWALLPPRLETLSVQPSSLHSMRDLR